MKKERKKKLFNNFSHYDLALNGAADNEFYVRNKLEIL